MTRSSSPFLAFVGTLFFLATAALPAPADSPPAEPPPAGAKEHCHVFLVNGVDPLRVGNLAGLSERLQERGFPHTYYGELYQLQRLHDIIRKVHHDDPQARFTLVGFSLGANRICDLASRLQDDGIRVDLLVFLSGNHWLGGLPKERPENVGRVVNILASGALKNTGRRDWAENHQLRSTWHFGTPAHGETLQLLTDVLGQDTVAAKTP